MSVEPIPELCGTFHNITELSTFSGVASLILLLPTAGINFIILFAIVWIIRNAKGKNKYFFYKLLLNIALADFLKGIVAGPSSVVFHFKEASGRFLWAGDEFKMDAMIVHLTLLITDSAALVSVSFLSIDRIVALYYPIKYRVGISNAKENMILLSTWPIAVAIVTPYFIINYIKELVVFGGVTMSVTVSSLLLVTIVFQHKFKLKKRPSFTSTVSDNSFSENINADSKNGGQENLGIDESSTTNSHTEVTQKLSGDSMSSLITKPGKIFTINGEPINEDSIEDLTKPRSNTTVVSLSKIKLKSRSVSVPDKETIIMPTQISSAPANMSTLNSKNNCVNFLSVKSSNERSTTITSASKSIKKPRLSRQEKRVTRAFIKMLIVFLLTYIPILFMILYMNFSPTTNVNCVVRHVMRDFTVIFIMSSSLFRGINFLVTLRHLRTFAKKMLKYGRN